MASELVEKVAAVICNPTCPPPIDKPHMIHPEDRVKAHAAIKATLEELIEDFSKKPIVGLGNFALFSRITNFARDVADIDLEAE